jgi:hypothetical protein
VQFVLLAVVDVRVISGIKWQRGAGKHPNHQRRCRVDRSATGGSAVACGINVSERPPDPMKLGNVTLFNSQNDIIESLKSSELQIIGAQFSQAQSVEKFVWKPTVRVIFPLKRFCDYMAE